MKKIKSKKFKVFSVACRVLKVLPQTGAPKADIDLIT